MGTLADAVLDAGGEAIGVIPESLEAKEVAHQNLTELHVVESMHSRKQTMVDLAEGFVALPGGLGTVEEIFEVLTWTHLGFHEHPCGFLNVNGYYDDLIGSVVTFTGVRIPGDVARLRLAANQKSESSGDAERRYGSTTDPMTTFLDQAVTEEFVEPTTASK